jgi:hypothetical protein
MFNDVAVAAIPVVITRFQMASPRRLHLGNGGRSDPVQGVGLDDRTAGRLFMAAMAATRDYSGGTTGKPSAAQPIS